MPTENFINNIPVLFHPTKTVMIDDHPSFLNMLAGFLMIERVFIKFPVPKKAIDYIIDYDNHFKLQNFFTADFKTLLHYLSTKQRFSQIATIFLRL